MEKKELTKETVIDINKKIRKFLVTNVVWFTIVTIVCMVFRFIGVEAGMILTALIFIVDLRTLGMSEDIFIATSESYSSLIHSINMTIGNIQIEEHEIVNKEEEVQEEIFKTYDVQLEDGSWTPMSEWAFNQLEIGDKMYVVYTTYFGKKVTISMYPDKIYNVSKELEHKLIRYK